MIRQDYIMRMIEQLARVLAKVFFNKQQGNYKEAVENIENAFNTLIGFNYKMISVMSIEDIISLLSMSKESASVKCIITAKLFKERTEIKELSNNNQEEIAEGYQKSLILFIEGLINDEDPSANEFSGYYSDIEIVIKKIGNNLPIDLRFKLFKYYELTGNYAKAEDELFRLKDLQYENIEQEGIRFYNELEKLSDAKLKEGNFSKEEVFQGMMEFRQKKN